jgi:membrane protein DedA with SNARE-associated domain
VLTTVATVFGSTVLRSTVLRGTVLGSTGFGSTLFGSTGPQPVLPGFLNALSSPLGHYGLWAVLFFVLVEDFGIPVPGETILIAAAIFAGSGRLNVVAVGVVGFCAAVLGDNIGYAIGRFGGRAVVERWGKYVFITDERLDKAEDFFHRHGGKIIVIARFVEGLRQANGIIAGITEMKWLKFLFFNALGAALWVGTWVSVGYFAGRHITTIYNGITTYSLYAAIAVAVLIAAWVAARVRRHRRSRGPATAEAEDGGSPEAVDADTVLKASDADTAVEASDADPDSEMHQADGENISGTEPAVDGQGARPPDVAPGRTAIAAQGAEAELPAEGNLPPEAVRRPRGGPGDLAVKEVVVVGGNQDADRAGGGARAGVRGA